MKYFLTIFLLITLFSFISCNSTEQNKLQVNKEDADTIAVKLQLVTSMVQTPVQLNTVSDNSHRLFITDLQGRIFVLKNGSVLPKPFLDIRKKLEQKDSLLEIKSLFSVAFHPQFAANKKFYVCYNAPAKKTSDKCSLVVSEFTASDNDPDVADSNSERRIFEFECKEVEGLGSQIAFGPDGYLYISIGDHGDSSYVNRAEDLSVFNGKLLRIDVNKNPYAIPNDNPFIQTKNERPEIYAYGFRRLWRFSFDDKTHELIGGDVGEAKQEEIDVVEKGKNYGWPKMEGDSVHDKDVTDKSLFTAPVISYSHKEGICVIAGHYYYGNDVPALKNKYVFADFNCSLFTLVKNAKGDWIRNKLKIVNKPKETFFICSCDTDENNEMYISGFFDSKSGPEGAVYKIVKG